MAHEKILIVDCRQMWLKVTSYCSAAIDTSSLAPTKMSRNHERQERNRPW